MDLRKSSFKKIGKLLESMSTGKQGEGFIDYTENKQKGHKVITKVYRDSLTDWVPEFKLKRVKNKGNEESKQSNPDKSNAGEYPKIKIDEVY